MKVAHFAIFGPHRCGLYHTTKEMVLAERSVGIEAEFIAVDDSGKSEVKKDGSFTTKELEWAYGADVLVRHTAIPTHLQCSGKPVVMVLHGRPESSVLLEKTGNKVVQAVAGKAKDCRYKKFVTLWREYEDIWRNIVGDKIECVPACVDLDEFTVPERQWDTPSILVSDMWRDDVTPFNVIFAAHKFALESGGKVHLVGLDKELIAPMSLLMEEMNNKGTIGDVATLMPNIKDWYAKCNMMVTPHVIATRSVREALATGMKLVGGTGNIYTQFTANPMDIDGYAKAISACWEGAQNSRGIAEYNFDFERVGLSMRDVFEEVLHKDPHPRKVFVDVGAHLGESVRRFYREVEDADEYEVYCFEPDPKAFALLDKNIGHIPNVNLINACLGTKDALVTYYPASNHSEGGTIIPNKMTGGVRYKKPMKVDCYDLARWWQANCGEYNIIKMNIEGGEYDLMAHMLEHGIVADKLFVQLHAHKFRHGPNRQRMQQEEGRFFNSYKGRMFFTNKGFYPFNAE